MRSKTSILGPTGLIALPPKQPESNQHLSGRLSGSTHVTGNRGTPPVPGHSLLCCADSALGRAPVNPVSPQATDPAVSLRNACRPGARGPTSAHVAAGSTHGPAPDGLGAGPISAEVIPDALIRAFGPLDALVLAASTPPVMARTAAPVPAVPEVPARPGVGLVLAARDAHRPVSVPSRTKALPVQLLAVGRTR